MSNKNDITGDVIKTKNSNPAYSEGWDRIFGKKEKEPVATNEQLRLYDIDYDGCFIDPPNGSMYGFPKQFILSEHKTFRNLLLISNYPEKDIDFALNHMRILMK